MKLSGSYNTPPSESGTAVTSRKVPVGRWMQGLKKAMPVLLDTTGIILLSSSAMLWSTIAGLAVAGVGCFVLNWRFHG